MITTQVIGSVGVSTSRQFIGAAFRNFNQQILKLFTNGEQGFAYDPNDLSTLYQDAAGTTPVTAAGQPVGLMLDKSKGLAVGEELFNQTVDFSTWTKTAAVTSATGNTFTTNGFGGCIINPISSQMVAGKGYLVRVVGRSTMQCYLRSGSSAEGRILINAREFDITIKSPISFADRTMYFQLQNSGTITVDSISIKELAGNHAYQTVSAARPILQRNATTGAYYLAFDGADDFLQTNNIDFTATDKVSLFAGLYTSNPGVQFIMETSANYSANVGAFELTISEVTSGGYTLAYRAANNTNQYSSQPIKPIPRSSVIAGKIDMSKRVIGAEGGVLLRENAISTGKGYTGSYIGGALGNYPLYIGRRGGAIYAFNGHLYSLIGIGRLTSDSETKALEKSIAKNTGVTLNV